MYILFCRQSLGQDLYEENNKMRAQNYEIFSFLFELFRLSHDPLYMYNLVNLKIAHRRYSLCEPNKFIFLWPQIFKCGLLKRGLWKVVKVLPWVSPMLVEPHIFDSSTASQTPPPGGPFRIVTGSKYSSTNVSKFVLHKILARTERRRPSNRFIGHKCYGRMCYNQPIAKWFTFIALESQSRRHPTAAGAAAALRGNRKVDESYYTDVS